MLTGIGEGGECLEWGFSRASEPVVARKAYPWPAGSWSPGGMILPGCGGDPGPPKAQAPSFRGISLKVGAVDDPAILTGVSLLRGEWEASRGGQIAMVENVVAAAGAPGRRRRDLLGSETRRPGRCRCAGGHPELGRDAAQTGGV